MLNKLLLGHIPELPHGKSWRFVDKDYAFPDPLNPFLTPFPEMGYVPRSADPVQNYFYFFGVKIGDVDFTANPQN